MKLIVSERTWFITALSRPSMKTTQLTDPAKSIAALTLVSTCFGAVSTIPDDGAL